jgi:hypothetical protein
MDATELIERMDRHGDALGVLFTAYLGQDWVDDFGEPWTNAVDAFVARVGVERARAARAEPEALVSDLEEPDLRRLLDEGMHVAFDWNRARFATARAWLEALRDELRRRTPQEA